MQEFQSYPGTTHVCCRLTLDKEDIEPGKSFSKEDVLLMGVLSARWENNDAIDQAMTSAFGGRDRLAGYRVTKSTPFNPVDKRTTAWVASEEHGDFVATKGAPQVILGLIYTTFFLNLSDRMPTSAYVAFNLLLVAGVAEGFDIKIVLFQVAFQSPGLY